MLRRLQSTIMVVIGLVWLLLGTLGCAAETPTWVEGLADDIVFVGYDRGKATTADDFLPYTAYVDTAGVPRAWFFDGFIYWTDSTSIQDVDWARPLFTPGEGLWSLDAAVAKTAEALGQPPATPRQVYLTVPMMIGTVPERKERMQRFIDETRKLWQAAGFPHLQLAGYYWYHEGVRDPSARETIEWTYAYLHSLQGQEPAERAMFKLLIVPYDYGKPNRPQVKEWSAGALPVDALWLQPNYIWPDRGKGYERQDLDNSVQFALEQGAGVEMEYDSGVPVTGWKTARYYHYLGAGASYSFMHLPTTYYQGDWGFLESAVSPFPATRQLYEDTFAFAQGIYTPRSIIISGPSMHLDARMEATFKRFSQVGDFLLPKGLWPGRRESAESISTLRLVEPDPNQSQLVILSLRASTSEGSASDTMGRVILEALDGTKVEVGQYPFDGQVHTLWYTLPSTLLRRNVAATPKNRLAYIIRFSAPIELQDSWVRSTQTVMSWHVQQANLWQETDPLAYSAQEGRTWPGVTWDEVGRTVRWAGMDSSGPLLVGVETADGNERVYTVPASDIHSDGTGSLALPIDQVVRVWAHPADLPFYLAFGAEGDTSAISRRPGVGIIPDQAWTFVGQPVGVTRRLVGTGLMQLDVPDNGSPYSLKVTLADVNALEWELQRDGQVLGSGTLAAKSTEALITIPEGGRYQVTWKGTASFLEAWLTPCRSQ